MSEPLSSAIRDHIWLWLSAFAIIVAFVVGHATGRSQGLKAAWGRDSGAGDVDFGIEDKLRRRYRRACRIRARRDGAEAS